MFDKIDKVLDAVRRISDQVEGLEPDDICPEMAIFGDGSFFDSFAILLLLIELEQSIAAENLVAPSLVEWFSALDAGENAEMNLKEFSQMIIPGGQSTEDMS